MEKNNKFLITVIIATIILGSMSGGAAGYLTYNISAASGDNIFEKTQNFILGESTNKSDNNSSSVTSSKILVKEESSIIDVVEKTNNAVVSIIVTKDLPVIERYYRDPGTSDFFRRFFGGGFDDFFQVPEYRQNGTETQEVGGGTGFLVSSDGYILTNRHVVFDDEADYTVLLNDESKHEAQVLAKDPFNDIAILKIDSSDLPYIELGDSSDLKVGQSVITIGNALGEFRNTVSTGVISGLSRNIIAGGGGQAVEELMDVIQTDASINPGNSGGPLLDISGRAIGMNTAIAQGAENIGFAIPIDAVKKVYESVKENGKIVRPWLGVRYVMINSVIAEENNLDYDYGALIIRGDERTDLAVIPGSPADKAGLVENDIILEVDGERIDDKNPLARAIADYSPGDTIKLKISHRGGEEDEIEIKLTSADQ